MLRTISASQLTEFRTTLRQAFEMPGHEVHVRTLTTPGGPIPRARLLWQPNLGMWGYFHPRTSENDNRWLCWYGLHLGEPSHALTPAIEINLAVVPDNKHAAGRALSAGPDAGYFLGHKGGLGGGRGGQMSHAIFDQQIRGFAREPVQLGISREENVFVIGALSSPQLLLRLKTYVSECVRLRAIARQSHGAAQAPADAPIAGQGEFSPEHDVNGTGGGGPATPYEINRVHGRVLNALQAKLGAAAVNSTRSNMRPDLYILGANGEMEILFEVKGCTSFQSWFTAIGQLVVYGAGEAKPPMRVLVCPTPIQTPNFSRALKLLSISLVTFAERPNTPVTFEGLDAVLAEQRARSSAI
jgi:hypothetical protein